MSKKQTQNCYRPVFEELTDEELGILALHNVNQITCKRQITKNYYKAKIHWVKRVLLYFGRVKNSNSNS